MIFLNWKKSRNYASDYTINHYRNSKPFQTCIAQKCPKKEKTRLIALVGAVSSLSLHRNCDEKVDAINGTRYTKDKLRAACIQPAKYREMGWPLARVWRRRGAQISSCVSSEGGRWTGLFGSKLDCAHVTRGKSSRHRAVNGFPACSPRLGQAYVPMSNHASRRIRSTRLSTIRFRTDWIQVSSWVSFSEILISLIRFKIVWNCSTIFSPPPSIWSSF